MVSHIYSIENAIPSSIFLNNKIMVLQIRPNFIPIITNWNPIDHGRTRVKRLETFFLLIFYGGNPPPSDLLGF
jgi:hypothetical protein